MIKKLFPLSLLALFACSAPAPHTPAAKSSEETAIISGVLATIAPDLNNQPVAIKVNSLCVYRDYAHIAFTPTNPTGGEFNYDATHYSNKNEDPDDRFNDTDADAILRNISGKWVVLAYGLRLHEPPAYMLDPDHWQDNPAYRLWPKQILACK